MSFGGSGGGSGKIATDGDVALSNVANGDTLQYNSSLAKWENVLPAGSGTTLTSSQKTGNYTFKLADAGTVVEGTDASAQTFTIPANSSVAFPVGTTIEVFQDGAGQITIAGASGVTLRSDGGNVSTTGQYATIGLRQRATDEWVLSGDLV